MIRNDTYGTAQMSTPIYDFVTRYMESGMSRLHMPGHKGRGPIGIEARDITEIRGADVLSEGAGIIGESEANASALFGSGHTFYVTEGSSQAIRGMLHLALSLHRQEPFRSQKKSGGISAPCPRNSEPRPLILAARNVHRAFVSAAALLDLDVAWLYGADAHSVQPAPEDLEKALRRCSDAGRLPFAIYLTSPDYLGSTADIRALADCAHRFGLPLLTDNAHGACLHFLDPPCHPLDLGADLCCDSAHKTLSALTGAAYLHVSKPFAARYGGVNTGSSAGPDSSSRPHERQKRFQALCRESLALYGSTSPSWLILQSLDLTNRLLAEGYDSAIRQTAARVSGLKEYLKLLKIPVFPGEPLKLTAGAPTGFSGDDLADRMRVSGIEPEFADVHAVVLMFSPGNTEEDFRRVRRFFRECSPLFEGGEAPPDPGYLWQKPLEQAVSIREAVFAPQEEIDVRECPGRILGAVTVSCPPAVPVAVSGERLTEELVPVFLANHIKSVRVLL